MDIREPMPTRQATVIKVSNVKSLHCTNSAARTGHEEHTS